MFRTFSAIIALCVVGLIVAAASTPSRSLGSPPYLTSDEMADVVGADCTEVEIYDAGCYGPPPCEACADATTGDAQCVSPQRLNANDRIERCRPDSGSNEECHDLGYVLWCLTWVRCTGGDQMIDTACNGTQCNIPQNGTNCVECQTDGEFIHEDKEEQETVACGA